MGKKLNVQLHDSKGFISRSLTNAVGFGGYGGLLVHQEHETKAINSKKSIEVEEDFGFNPYRYGLSTRVDVGPFKLFGNYDLSSTWEDTDFRNAEVGIWFDF